MGGSLQLKGGDGATGSTVKNKKKKKSSTSQKLREEEYISTSTSRSGGGGGGGGGNGSGGEGSSGEREKDNDKEFLSALDAGKTDAQRRFEEVQKKRLLEKAAKAATKTHKERVADFNERLENLSEHYDIPKVGPG